MISYICKNDNDEDNEDNNNNNNIIIKSIINVLLSILLHYNVKPINPLAS